MKARLALIAGLLVLSGCVIKRTGHEKETSLGGFHAIGVTYVQERTNHTTIFSIGLVQTGAGKRLPVVGAAKQFDVNPLNVQPKAP
jgi:hypothetical protein